MRAFMSNPDSGVRNLRPELYQADRAWLEAESQHEARRILAEAEPRSRTGEDRAWDIRHGMLLPHTPTGFWAAPTMSAKEALAEALARFVGEGQ